MGCCTSNNKTTKIVSKQNPKHRASKFVNIKLEGSQFIQSNDQKISEVYKLGSRVGVGAFGEVRRCIHKITGDLRAVKIYHKSVISSMNDQGTQFFEEIAVMKRLDHPNIIKIYEYFEDNQHHYIVMEYLQGGELYEKMQHGARFSEMEIGMLLRQLMSVIAYIHSNSIVHRDIKPENVMLEERSHDISIKIIDFGTAIQLARPIDYNQLVGTSYYLAPEVARREEYNELCDIWSCGVVMYMLLTGFPPFAGKNDEIIIEKLLSQEYTKPIDELIVSDSAKDLLHKMLSPKETRISAMEVLQHPWLNAQTISIDPQQISQVIEQLCKFNRSSRIRDALMLFITSQIISQKDIKYLREAFMYFDKDGDGKLGKQDLMEVLRETVDENELEDKAEKLLIQIDGTQSGVIAYTEFICAALPKNVILADTILERAFGLIDVNGDGQIQAEELMMILAADRTGGDLAQWHDVMMDLNNSGNSTIDFGIFMNFLKSNQIQANFVNQALTNKPHLLKTNKKPPPSQKPPSFSLPSKNIERFTQIQISQNTLNGRQRTNYFPFSNGRSRPESH